MLIPAVVLVLQLAAGETSSLAPHAISRVARRAPPAETVVPNDNRRPGGTKHDDVLQIRLVAQRATWRPSQNVDSTATVLTFGEEGGAPRIPGPLVRTQEGSTVRVSVRNAIPESTLVVYGLRAGTVANDTVQVAPGAVRVLSFRATKVGTFVYYGTTTHATIDRRSWRDSQLTGAIVVDPRGTRPDSAERIFVITVLDLAPEDTVFNKKHENIWERAINGRSWPLTERITGTVGDTLRWRWINGSYLPHPMHLHGFHFRVTAKGERNVDSTYAEGSERTVVTEFMMPGATFRMNWVPTRAGAWLMHCHMIPHIIPFPERPDTVQDHDTHDVTTHPMRAMAGLVLGISVAERAGVAAAAPPAPTRQLRVMVQQALANSGQPVRRSYVQQRGAAPRADSVEAIGTPLILTRDETTAITVVNRLREPTTVHWHGMELESVYDGVSGWGRTRSSIAPILAPGDSFTVAFTPPKAGTFIYHTHMDEGAQLRTGLYAPLIVMRPGERYDPSTDL
ncbi:MAG: multicopper oxidase domain-containing protein, partial [Gemmatimonadaceae bacterium]